MSIEAVRAPDVGVCQLRGDASNLVARLTIDDYQS